MADEISNLSSLETKAFWVVVAAAGAFLLKLVRDYVVEKERQATGLRIVAVYIRVAVKTWEEDRVNPAHAKEERENRLKAVEEQITKGAEEGEEGYTPFIPYCRHDDLSVDDVRDKLGFLDSTTLKHIVRFIQSEALVHALAEDFRSEYVRRQFTPDRKINLVRQYNIRVYEAYKWGKKAVKALAPLEHCPRLFWYLPVGNCAKRVIGWMTMRLRQQCDRARERMRSRTASGGASGAECGEVR